MDSIAFIEEYIRDSVTPNEDILEALRSLKEDAERWRALVNCKRIRILGSAGILPHHPKDAGYAHIGLEIWTRHSVSSLPESVELLTTFVDFAREVQK